MAGDVKQRMIERTAVLLAMKGLEGTSFSEVLAASGAPRGSLYHHFPGGKTELVLAAVSLAGDFALTALERMRGRPAPEVAAGFVALWRGILAQSGFDAGCAVLAVTVAANDSDVLAASAKVFRGWRVRLADLLVAGGVAPDRAGALSVTLIAACEGAVVLARAEKSMEPFDLVAAEQLAAIRSAQGTEG